MTALEISMQTAIALFGLTAIFLMGSPRAQRRRLGAVFGLCSQPFWLVTTYQAGQWGMLLLSLAYTVAWLRASRSGL